MSELEASLLRAAKALAGAKRPAILVGPEGAPSAATLVQLADRLGAALLTTPDAISVIDHRRSCGTFSFGASSLAREVIGRADVVLATSALGEFSSRLGEAFRRHTLIQVTDRLTGVGRNAESSIALVAPSIHDTVKRLEVALGELVHEPRAPWFTDLLREARLAEPRVARPGLIDPVTAIASIEAALPDPARVCLDVTSGALHAYEHLKLTTTQRAFSSVENSACMGEALMASLGVRLASDLPTLAIVGDWGFCMAPSEIHTAVELKLDRYVVLIWANGGGALVGAGIESEGIAVPDNVWHWKNAPDFAQVARGYRALGVTVTDADALSSTLSRALRGSGPWIIEAKIDPAVPVPAGDRFRALAEART